LPTNRVEIVKKEMLLGNRRWKAIYWR